MKTTTDSECIKFDRTEKLNEKLYTKYAETHTKEESTYL